MSFNSPVFLFLFLPVFLIVYLAGDKRYKNLIALIASLIFFIGGQSQIYYLPVMLLVIIVNYYLSPQLVEDDQNPSRARRVLLLAIGFNLLLLVFFKAIAAYGIQWALAPLHLQLPDKVEALFLTNPLPLGFSYVIFQVISYLLDVYNGECSPEKRFLNFALYILLFPKIIIGPITRYTSLADSLENREVTAENTANGIRRFITGLAKKILIADTIGQIVTPAFHLASPTFSTGIAWLVIVGYSLQLYFDFSGYTDMAIGLGETLGFRFIENFNYPYISKSISEFWRRWHISLSSWFRDYVFMPLEFNRRRVRFLRQQQNILFVFLLTGLWHGLTLNFVIWGLIHGFAIALEMTGFGRWLKKIWWPLQHVYTLLIVIIAWVFFRAPNPGYAVQFIGRLFGASYTGPAIPFMQTKPLPMVDPSVWLALGLGVILSLPVLPWAKSQWEKLSKAYPISRLPASIGIDLLLLFLLIAAIAAMASSTFIVGIYENF